MIKNLFRPFLGNSNSSVEKESAPLVEGRAEPVAERVEIERSDHNISRKHISTGALNIIYDLNKAGYEAYLVGGGIRDLLLDLHPKDFDVATNATPDEISSLFRRSRIVGRRFQIVHVSMGRETIEVTTFRANHQAEQRTIHSKNKQHSLQNEAGMLLRDNVFGSVEEDALRRDFTVNALYYTVQDFKVIDFTNGLEDLQNRTLRMIGDPATRYLEDPVRMLRAIRFAAKLDFEIETNTRAPIKELAKNIQQVAAARLFDEINKLFFNSHARRCFDLAQEFDLFKYLFPAVQEELDRQPLYQHVIGQALSDTAARIDAKKPVTPAFLYASLLWPRVATLFEDFLSQGNTAQRAMQMASFSAIEEQLPFVSIPKRFSIAMREIWQLQNNLIKSENKRAISLLSHPRFRAAYDFLKIRELAGEDLLRGASYWTDLQEKHPVPQNHERRHQKRRRSNRRRPNRQPSKES